MAATKEELAILLDRIALLEKRLDVPHQKEVTVTENTTSSAIVVSHNLGTQNGTSDEDVKKEDKETEPRSRARIVISKVDPETGQRKDYSPKEEAEETPKAQKEEHAFLLRKNVDLSGPGQGGELEILSLDLWSMLQELLSQYPYHLFSNNPAMIESPYEPFILNWDSLEDAAKGSSEGKNDTQARADLKDLLTTLSNGSGDAKLDKYFKARKSHIEQKSVTFETLWTLFTPGALVYGRPFLEQDQLFIVQDNWKPWPDPSAKTWYLQCWTYDWDGKQFRRLPLRVDIERFEGQMPINSLPFYPLDYHMEREDLIKRLKARGATYKRVCTTKEGSRMFEYKGDVVGSKEGITGVKANNDEENDKARSNQIQIIDEMSAISSSKPDYIESRVMVDFDSYFKYGPNVATVGNLMHFPFIDECNCQDCQDNPGKQKMSRRRFDSDAAQKDWEEEQYWLCPPRVLGYLLRDKKWAQLQVDKLQDIPKEDPEHSWERIVLPDGDTTKRLVLDLVDGHKATKAESDEGGLAVDDIVAKKGKGLVILLYGPPGVGKTSTAETVAIAARKPLFAISVADVGTKPEYVEANLAKIFDLATTWQAILLIDEADVFLTSRGQSEFSSTDRNALVSVFLRVLEYYQGILMLTTNQIAQFDVAVQSRIHVAIKYTQLSPEQIVAIFDGFLKPLIKKGCLDDADGIREWVKEEMSEAGLDGRQIRNIVTSALALARAEKKTMLDKRTLKRISTNVRSYKHDFSLQFQRYKISQEGK